MLYSQKATSYRSTKDDIDIYWLIARHRFSRFLLLLTVLFQLSKTWSPNGSRNSVFRKKSQSLTEKHKHRRGPDLRDISGHCSSDFE